ncbi:MAG: DUF3616 domain-containing protein [Pseudomonadota bacterium]
MSLSYLSIFQFFLLIFCFIGFSQKGNAAAQSPQATQWSITKNFAKGKKAREGLSGAACAAKGGEKTGCVIVNDEKNYAQFFTLDQQNRIIKPGKTIRLLPKKDKNGQVFQEMDAEAASYDNGFFYVTGSHGKSRKKCQTEDARYTILRFPVKQNSGKPTFRKYGRSVSEQIEHSQKLRDIIRKAKHVGGVYADKKCLNEGGTNIEGLAVVKGEMFLGFRAPSVEGQAVIMQLPVSAVFDGKTAVPQMHLLKLGPRVGIRDIAKVSGGLLIVGGATVKTDEQDITPSLYFWNLESKKLTKLAELPRSQGAKIETLLVLQDTKTASKIKYKILVFYESTANGDPVEFEISRNVSDMYSQ